MKLSLVRSLFLPSFLFALPAAAEVDALGAYGPREQRGETEQDMAVELRFGPYRPSVDDDLSAKPYDQLFGDSTRYYVGAEFDWQVLRIPYFGTLGPGFGFGYTRSTSQAITERNDERSDQPTSLSILPMYVVAVARADVIARETPVPLVPYAKLGIGYALWWVKTGDETARGRDGRVGRGRSYGPQFALGIMLELDWMDLDDARSADAAIGMNHSYLFAEWYRSQLDGFGGDDQLDAGTDTWMVGITAEF